LCFCHETKEGFFVAAVPNSDNSHRLRIDQRLHVQPPPLPASSKTANRPPSTQLVNTAHLPNDSAIGRTIVDNDDLLVDRRFVNALENRLQRVYDAPVDVHLSKHDVVQPDLVVILNAKKFIVTPTKVKGVPYLLVEILSPSSIDYDRERKRNLYERCGIPEFWIVDPFDHKLEQLVLRDGRYQLEPEADIVRPVFITDIAIPLSEVW
jgi:hypothetical protein